MIRIIGCNKYTSNSSSNSKQNSRPEVFWDKYSKLFRIAQLKSDISAEYYEAISVVAFHCRTPRSKLFHDGCPYQIQNSQWKSMNWFLYDKDLGHEWVDFDTVLKMFESMTIMFEAVNKSCNFFKH